MKKVTNGFSKQTFPEFAKQLTIIVNNMTGNTNFPTLQPQVVTLSAAADNYLVLDTKAAKRDKDVLIARNNARVEITNLLHQLGFAVSSVAAGNEEMLSSSGFPFTKPPQKSNPLQKPTPPKVSLGINNGAIVCKTNGQKGMKSVKYYITAETSALAADTAGGWDIVSWNSTKYTFADLIPGQRYYIKVGLVGVRGQEVVSEPVSYIPQ